MQPIFSSRSVYHFTPISNLPTILQHGLLSRGRQEDMKLPLRSIAWKSIQGHRSELAVPVGPRGVAQDYVPFYFSNLTHMLLAVILNKVVDEQEIIHIEMPLSIMERYPAVFTDAPTIPHSSPHFYERPKDLVRLDWDAIDMPTWKLQRIDLRHAHMAELLVYQKVPIQEATRIIVWDQAVAAQVRQMYDLAGLPAPRVEADSNSYFLDTSSSEPKPRISGPSVIRQAVENTVQNILRQQTNHNHPRFQTLRELRDALNADFSALPETAELVGLETDNRAHYEDVGSHTRRVLAELLNTAEYLQLNIPNRTLLEVATYLHDIGKGPKSRWAASGGKQQIDMDHPVKALPMLERILSEEIAEIGPTEIDLICRLVAYHDIIGGVLASGRQIQELLSVVHNERELDMLMALSRADAAAINPTWGQPEARKALRQEVIRRMRSVESHSEPENRNLGATPTNRKGNEHG